jgi:hypothetical protein
MEIGIGNRIPGADWALGIFFWRGGRVEFTKEDTESTEKSDSTEKRFGGVGW